MKNETATPRRPAHSVDPSEQREIASEALRSMAHIRQAIKARRADDLLKLTKGA